MRVLVTGGAGFIGSHLTDSFLARGDEVVVVDDLSSGRPDRLDSAAVLHKASITDAESLTAIVAASAPELICHLAAQIDVRASVESPALDAHVNLLGTVNVLEAALAAGSRVLFASSGGALYGREAPVPSPEEVPPAPESPYGVAKLCAEQYIGLYNRLHGTRHSVLRFANVYGPRQDPAGEGGVIAIFCAAALAGRDPVIYGDGTQTRDYIYVGDVARCFLAAADRGRSGVWNVGTGAEVTVLELAGVIARLAGHPITPHFAPARPGELLRSAVASGRAARDLGWWPATGLADGVRAVYEWIQAGAPVRAAC
ncbi:MAG: NAD-dependent epimerase/dehydratase family protein [Nocardiopsaceae bacterium]|jgi:UDP-glucose 4-epimerase|nr:NAD-dependent epimerase/dehydratase family protein [Nocardiopsaceae bacterium]